MNWEFIKCDKCGCGDYNDDMGTVEQTEDGTLCAGCRVNQMLEWNEEGGYYE